MRRISSFLIFIGLCLILSLTGCAGKSQDGYAGDYEQLWQMLAGAYPYLPYLEEQGVDVAGIRARYAAELTPDMTEDAFYEMLQKMFVDLGNFAHLDLVTPEMYQSYYFVFVSDEGAVADAQAAPFRDILTSDKLSERYEITRTIDVEQYQDKVSRRSRGSVLYFSDCDALYIKIPSFAHEYVAEDTDIVTDALRLYPDTKHVIFDIMSNTGGSDAYWQKNLVAPFGGQYAFSWRSFLKSSDLTEAYHAGCDLTPVSELSDAPAWAERMGLDRCFVTDMVLPPKEDTGATFTGDVRRWLLISDKVYSASEKFTCFCKNTGWATVVGMRTSGDGLGTTPVLMRLQKSGLLIRFSDTVGENPDGSINAVDGTTPDIFCGKGTSPLTYCLELIREQGR